MASGIYGFGGQSWRLAVRNPPAFKTPPAFPLYVRYGTPTGGVGTKDNPISDIRAAMALCSGYDDWVIRVKSADPIRDQITYNSSSNLTIEGWDDEPFSMWGSVRPSVWTYVGDDIWSAVLGVTAIGSAVCLTMDETVGDRVFQKKLPIQTTPPDQPSAFRICYSGGTAYVNLGGANPNNHTIEVSTLRTTFLAVGPGRLTVRDLNGLYQRSAGVTCGESTQPDNTGRMTVEDCTFLYSSDGVSATGKFENVVCRNVTSHRHSNDAFSVHAPLPGTTATIFDINGCDGSYSGDLAGQSSQGCSAHEFTTMNVRGGKFNYNVSGGMVSINDSKVHLDGSTEFGPIVMDRNMRLGNTAGLIQGQGSCAWLDNCSGSVAGQVIVSNGGGVGVRVETPNAVTGLNNIHSINNALPDIIAA